jgi:hypothetical protein
MLPTAQQQHTQNNDTFGLTKVDDIVALRQVSALRASKNAIPDTNKAITALADFFTHLEVHPFHQHEFGEQALLTYQACVRQNWHDTIKTNSAFNIALFNKDLLQAIYKEVVDKAQVQSLSEVSFFSSLNVRVWRSCMSFSYPILCHAISVLSYSAAMPSLNAPSRHHAMLIAMLPLNPAKCYAILK